MVDNLSLVTAQKQTPQGMVNRTNFPRTILFPLLLLHLGNLWNFNQITLDFHISQRKPKMRHTVRL